MRLGRGGRGHRRELRRRHGRGQPGGQPGDVLRGPRGHGAQAAGRRDAGAGHPRVRQRQIAVL